MARQSDQGDVGFGPNELRQASRVYFFDNENLVKYRGAVQAKLNEIVERVAEGADANLGYEKRTWQLDIEVAVDFLVMEGPTSPIIQAHIRSTGPFPEGETELIQEKYYPYMWVGISVFKAELDVECEASNPNCPFWGYAVDGQLYGLDPAVRNDEIDHDINDSAALQGGENYGGGFGQNQRVVDTYGGMLADRLLQMGPGADFDGGDVGDFLHDQGNFNWQDYLMQESVMISNGGIIAMEGAYTTLTQPSAALADIDDEFYWQRSLVIDPDGTFFEGTEGANTIPGRMSVIRPGGPGSEATEYYDVATGVFGKDGVSLPGPITVSYDDEIRKGMRGGTYEISAFAQSFECECSKGELHIRLVLGKQGQSLKKVTRADGSFTFEADPTRPSTVKVVDFFPETIGSQNDETVRFYFRDIMLGGLGEFFERSNGDNGIGPNQRGAGWWDQSIYVDVQNGSFRLDDASVEKPFFEQGGPSTNPQGQCGAGCVNCSGNSLTAGTGGAVGVPYPGPTCQTVFFQGVFGPVDFHGGNLFHLARVWQTDANGCICYIMLVGNDGGQGQCLVKPYGWGYVTRAIGRFPDGSFGNTGSPDCAGGFQVGQLVAVVGSSLPCVSCKVSPGRVLVVQEAVTTEVDYTHEFYAQLRCGESQAVQQFWQRARDELRDFHADCGSQGPEFDFKPDVAKEDQLIGTLVTFLT